MHESKHIIQKQVLEIETGDPTDRFHFPEHLRQWYYEKMLPRLEQLFDRYAGAGRLIRVEELKVDTLIIHPDNWEEELTNSILQQAELILRQSAIRAAPQPDQEISAPEALLHFIRNGALPWYAAGNNFFGSAQMIIPPGPLPAYRSRLLELLSAGEIYQRRLILQCRDGFLEQLFSSTLGYALLRPWIAYLPALSPPDKKLFFWKAVIRSAILESNAGGSTGATEDRVLQIYLQQFDAGQLKALYEGLPDKMRQEAGNAIKRGIALDAEDMAREEDTRGSSRGETLAPEEDGPALVRRGTATAARPADPEEGIYINNAGLVLLHPFLPQFFGLLELQDRNGFVHATAQQHAILLTQYMITPGLELPEHELALNKILCGYPMEETLPAAITVSAIELSEINDLLQTVVDNWKMHGVAVNTTVDNLRVSFLQRSGKLTRRAGNWLLQVEPKAYDIVMNGLPWSISRIQYKWMPELLRVEWVG